MAWRDISSAPKDGTRIIIYDPRYGPLEGLWNEPDDYRGMSGNIDWHDWLGIDGEIYEPTHWQPLPAPPEQENG